MTGVRVAQHQPKRASEIAVEGVTGTVSNRSGFIVVAATVLTGLAYSAYAQLMPLNLTGDAARG